MSATAPNPLHSSLFTRIAVAVILCVGLAGCGDQGKGEVKSLKDQVQTAYGKKDFRKGLELSEKGFALARAAMGDKANDTLYFAQAISENNLGLHNARAAIAALKQEIALRAAANQNEKKLQPRRTLLIKLAEENNDRITAADQAVAVARGIQMAPGKDPQPVYRSETVYPPEQYRQKVEGDVQVSYGLDASGKVVGARVLKATPPNVFDDAALDSFREWRFTPMLDSKGEPVAASGFTFTIAFRLSR
ncbi:MAG: energy transducer TonB [Rhodospirillaceae bacterium]|nr:energy transducer TonB [Rhodospirillaceae bacterium]